MQAFRRTWVLNVVGLTPEILTQLPKTAKWAERQQQATIKPILPALTSTVQATYLTGKLPKDHGVVANGWLHREVSEIMLWKQSRNLVQQPLIWELIKSKYPQFRAVNNCWWFNMYCGADYTVTPRPQYGADGRKYPDCYTQPITLRDTLQTKLGTFPLFHFWGPRTTIKSSEWIGHASIEIEKLFQPDFQVIYLPHLDYGMQKVGKNFSALKNDFAQLDNLLQELIHFCESNKIQPLLLSEYGITNVNRPIHINRILRKAGLINIRVERGGEYPDVGGSKAFALADHQIAHIYVNDPNLVSEVYSLLKGTPGIADLRLREEANDLGLNHPRSGEIIALAEPDSWFTYYYWLDDNLAPDFARVVDIHKKPGYDPVELFSNPEITALPVYVAWKLLKKKLGFRMLMDVIPLDATLVKGSHGILPENPADLPMLIGGDYVSNAHYHATDIFQIMTQALEVEL